MTDKIADEMEQKDGIETVDSWPIDSIGRGSEEYGVVSEWSTEDVLEALELALLDEENIGFHLAGGTVESDRKYDIVVSVHYHPLASVLADTLDSAETVTAYGLDWEPNDVDDCYEDDELVAPGPLEAWFEVSDADYDRVLDSIEDTINEWNDSHEATATLEVYGADSDHCHIGLSYTYDFETVLVNEYNLTPSRVWDEAGQTTGYIYANAEWLVNEVFINRFTGEATIDNIVYDPNNANDVELFRRYIREMYVEHTFEVPNVESDEVTDGLESFDYVKAADTWTGGIGENDYGIKFDSKAANKDDIIDEMREMLDSVEYYPFTLRDNTDLYADHTYDLIVSVTFQLS